MDRVDVIVLTKNSERVLKECFDSIFKNVPVNHLIVVDGHSTDSTLDIVRRFQEKYGNLILIQHAGTRGSARLTGIREVKTEWFLFVDSDVTLSDNWFIEAKNLVAKDVGAVWGVEVWAGIQNRMLLKLFLKITRRIFEIRGGTHDLLVRYEAVKDIDIPKDLHVFEDTFITEWIQKKGYKLIATYEPYCMHYRPTFVWTITGSLGIIAETMRYGPLKKVLQLVPAYGFYTVYVLYRSLSQKLKL